MNKISKYLTKFQRNHEAARMGSKRMEFKATSVTRQSYLKTTEAISVKLTLPSNLK